MQSGHTDSANFEECEISFFALGYFAPPADIPYETRFKGAPSGASGRLTHFRRCTSMTDEAFSRAAMRCAVHPAARWLRYLATSRMLLLVTLFLNTGSCYTKIIVGENSFISLQFVFENKCQTDSTIQYKWINKAWN